MTKNPYLDHQSEEILAAEPLELVVALCAAALDAVRDARADLADGRIAARSAHVSRAQEIVAELSGSLREDPAPELARTLRQLYAYVLLRLQEGNFRQEDRALAEVESLLATLSDAWRQCQIQNRQSQESDAVSADYFGGGMERAEAVSVSCCF